MATVREYYLLYILHGILMNACLRRGLSFRERPLTYRFAWAKRNIGLGGPPANTYCS